MVSGPLPTVGAHASLTGMAAFAASSKQLVGHLTGINAATQSLGDVSVSTFSRASSAVGVSTGAIIRSTGLIAAGLGLAAGAFKEFKSAAGVETTLKTIQALSQASDQDISGLGEAVNKTAIKFGEFVGPVSNLAQVLSRAGLSFKDIEGGALNATEALIKASKGELSTEEAAIAVAQGLTTFRLAASDASRVTDALANAANGSTASFGDLATSMKYLGTSALALGIPIEDASGAIAVMAQNSVRGSTAGTSLRAMLTALEKPTKDALAEMQKYNISLFNAQGQFIGLRNVVELLNKSFGDQAIESGKLSEMERANALNRIFTTRGAQAALALATGGTQQFDEATKQTVSTMEIANTIMQSAENSVKQFAVSLQVLSNDAILPLLPAIADLAHAGTNLATTYGPGFLKDLQAQLASLPNLFKSDFVSEFENNIGRAFDTAEQGAKLAAAAAATLYSELIKIPILAEAVKTGFELIPFVAVAAGSALLVGTMLPLIITLGKLTLAAAAVGGAVILVRDHMADLPGAFNTAGRLAEIWAEKWVAAARTVAGAVTSVASTIDNITGGALSDAAANYTAIWKQAAGEVQQAITNAITPAEEDPRFPSLPKLYSEIWQQAAGEIAQTIGQLAGFTNEQVASMQGEIEEAFQNQAPNSVSMFAESGTNSVAALAKNILAIIANATSGITTDFAVMAANVESILNGILAHVAQVKAEANSAAAQAALIDQRHGEQGVGPKIPAPRFTGGGGGAGGYGNLGYPSGGGGGGGAAKEPKVSDISKQIQAQLAGIPGAGKQLADFLAGIAKDAPERLAPMVNAIRAVRVEISRTVLAAKDLAETNALIANSDKAISSIQASMHKVELQAALAMLSYDKQLLGLRYQLLQIDQAEAPLRDRMTQIERQISKLQQDNLSLTRQRLELQLKMLPVQNQIADLEKKISDAKKPDLKAEGEKLRLELAQLPIQQQIAQIDKQIAEATRTNYSLQASILALQLQSLPIRQALSRLDAQAAKIHNDDLTLVHDRLEAELKLLGPKRQMLEIEQQLAALGDKQATLDDRRRELTAQGAIADAQHELDAISKQLDTTTDPEQAKALSARFDELTASLQQQQDALKEINYQQEKRNRNTELSGIDLEKQKAALEDQVKPVQDQIDRVKLQEDAVSLLADVQKNAIEAVKRGLEGILTNYDDQLLKLQQIAEIEALNAESNRNGLEQEKANLTDLLLLLQNQIDVINNQTAIQQKQADIVVNGYEQQREALEAILRPLQDQLDSITRIQEAERIRNEITITHLEEERRAIQDAIDILEDQRTVIQRQIDIVNLQKEGARIAFEEQKAHYQEQLLEEQIKRAELEETRVKQEEVFTALVLAMLGAITQSQAFTSDEAIEVSKRLGLWDDEVEKVRKRVVELEALRTAAGLANDILGITANTVNGEVKPAFDGLANDLNATVNPEILESKGALDGVTDSAKNAKDALDAIPREINIVVRYITIGSPGGGGGGGTNQAPPNSGGSLPASDPGNGGGGGESPGDGTRDFSRTASALRRSALDAVLATISIPGGPVYPGLPSGPLEPFIAPLPPPKPTPAVPFTSSGHTTFRTHSGNPYTNVPWSPVTGIPSGPQMKVTIEQPAYQVNATYLQPQPQGKVVQDMKALVALSRK